MLEQGLQDFVASQPGESIESEDFKITWDDNYDDDVKLLLPVILEAAVGYKELSDIEVLVKARLLEWISTSQGAGFLCVDEDVRRNYNIADIVDDFMDALLYTSAHWHEASIGQYTDLAME